LLAAVRKSSHRPAALDLVKGMLSKVFKQKSYRVSRSQIVRQAQKEIAPKQKNTEQKTIRQIQDISIERKQNIQHGIHI